MRLAEALITTFADCFTPEGAWRIIDCRPDDSAEDRLTELRAKANEGTLAGAEYAEYEEFVDTLDFVAALKSRLRRGLKTKHDRIDVETTPVDLNPSPPP